MEYERKAVGSVTVVQLSERDECAELGYCVGCDYWNRGFMSEAVKAVIDFPFAEAGVNRGGISHDVKNPASGAVARKCGLRLEGTKRQYFKAASGEFLDIYDYGIIRREWEKQRAGR